MDNAMNAKTRNGQPGECGECGISERNRARRFSRLSWKLRYFTLVMVATFWAGAVRSAQAICTPFWTQQTPVINMYGGTTPDNTWFLSHCAVLIPTSVLYTAASALTWNATAQANQYKYSWACSPTGFTTSLPSATQPGSTGPFITVYEASTCSWHGNVIAGIPSNALTVTGNGSSLAGKGFGFTLAPITLGATSNGTFVVTPGSTLTFTSTDIGPPVYQTALRATTSRAWTNTIPTSPASNIVVSNLFPSMGSSGSFVPTYAGTVSVISTNSYGTDTFPNAAGQTQPYTIATKAFFANNSAAIGSLYSDGASSFGTLLSSPTTGGGVGAAVDATGNVWSLASSGNSVTLFKDDGTLSTSYTGSNLNAATALAIDGHNRTWFANSNSLTAMTNAGASVFANAVGAGNVSTPTAMSVDNAGSLWVANSASNTVTEFIGLAAPVTVPTIAQVANVATGTLP